MITTPDPTMPADFQTRRARADELKPCPFCGSQDIANVSAGFAGPTNAWHAGDEIFAVNCKRCGASVPNRYRNHLVVADWNQRDAEARIAELQAEVEEGKRLTAQAKEGIHAVTEVAVSLQARLEAAEAELAARNIGSPSDRLHNICQGLSEDRKKADTWTVHALEEADAENVRKQQEIKSLRAQLDKAHGLLNEASAHFFVPDHEAAGRLSMRIDAHLATSKGPAA